MTRKEIAKFKEQIYLMQRRGYICLKKILKGWEQVNFSDLEISSYTLAFINLIKNSKNNWTLKIVYKWDLEEEHTFYLIKTSDLHEHLKDYELN